MLDMISCDTYTILAITAFVFAHLVPAVREIESSILKQLRPYFLHFSLYSVIIGSFVRFHFKAGAFLYLRNCHRQLLGFIPCLSSKLLLIFSIVVAHTASLVRTIELNAAATIIAFIRWLPVFAAGLAGLGVYYKSAVHSLLSQVPESNVSTKLFLALVIFKFLKVVVHTVSYLIYQPARAPYNRTLNPNDVTVIVPTVGDLGPEFQECIQSILANNPREVIVSVVGKAAGDHARTVCNALDAQKTRVIEVGTPNKRLQVVRAAETAQTKITCFADDHVFWPTTFLNSALIPFEDPAVGLIGTVKRVRRDRGGTITDSLLNYIACLYLERHNFECTASNNIDGGVFVISGRTSLTRTHIVQEQHFKNGFLAETWLFGSVGPLNADDDNFITRWMVTHGHKIVFHNTPEARIETTLGMGGNWTKFQKQLNRWARTTWRSNSTTLFADRTVWYAQPWCVYAVYFSTFVNLALFYDAALFYTLYCASEDSVMPKFAILTFFLFLSKMIKPISFYRRNPRDVPLIILGIFFGYYHSLVKLYTLFTCMKIAWGTRAGVDGVTPAGSSGGAPNVPPAGASTGASTGASVYPPGGSGPSMPGLGLPVGGHVHAARGPSGVHHAVINVNQNRRSSRIAQNPPVSYKRFYRLT